MPSTSPSFTSALTDFALRRPKVVVHVVLLAVVLSSLGFVRLSVDTDPENMLPADDPVRLRNAALEADFGVGPSIAIGLFGQATETTDGQASLWAVADDLAARDDVVAVNAVAMDGEPGVALLVSITEKDRATDVADRAEELIAERDALEDAEVAIAGQPLAEDAFGQQMFIQMAVFAPLAGAMVFALLLAFFRRLRLVLPAMALAMATVIITMGLLVGSGNTLHIMSSMIPIFLMPIAILDSVHLLSEFFDRYRGRRRAELIEEITADLARPIGFTSLTTGVGFAALLLVPIPPVRLFGLFVSIGVFLAWLFTLTLLPAMLVLIPEPRLSTTPSTGDDQPRSGDRLEALGPLVVTHRRLILTAFAGVALVAVPLLTTITVNDNPVRWFRSDHEIRQASEDLGRVLPGTFGASLVLTETEPGALDRPESRAAVAALTEVMVDQPEVGAVRTYLDGPGPTLRSESGTGPVANLSLALRTGDNTAMAQVVEAADDQLVRQPIPGVTVEWAGEAYLNLTWQEKMVTGMLVGFATTLAVILVLLVVLFRSLRWALAAVAPVLWTVLVVYAGLALLGRDFDMPVAVLSTMVLGIGVDFAIHFVERHRALAARHQSTSAAIAEFYREPARALTRNAVVIAIGFAPLVFSSLVPYVVVGVLLASIVGLSWLASLVVLPALTVSRFDDIDPGPLGSGGDVFPGDRLVDSNIAR